MNLRVQRIERTAAATHGQLFLGPALLCVTLENPTHEDKGPIPTGIYPVQLRYSPKFMALLPGLDHVPGFTEILIHAGNTASDTLGCILPGIYRVDARSIADSRMALGRILHRWQDWHGSHIEIRDP